jgi:hypothetical protein
MADIPLMAFPPGQAPAITAAITGLLCAVLGAVRIVDGAMTAVADEATVLALLTATTGTLQTTVGIEFERARWAAAGSTAAASA